MNSHVNQISRELNMSPAIVCTIHANYIHPHHITLNQKLSDNYKILRVTCRWAVEKIQFIPTFFSHVMFSDESRFESNGMLNRYNSHYYSNIYPGVMSFLGFFVFFLVALVWASVGQNILCVRFVIYCCEFEALPAPYIELTCSDTTGGKLFDCLSIIGKSISNTNPNPPPLSLSFQSVHLDEMQISRPPRDSPWARDASRIRSVSRRNCLSQKRSTGATGFFHCSSRDGFAGFWNSLLHIPL